MLQFGLAYYLQEKINGDFFAIIDTPNNPKKMFQNQKLVNFEKSWYFHDHIKKITKEPDFEYLSNFEKKYNIDLWKMAINERHFYRFNKFYKFTTNEILVFLEQECKLFESILDKVDPDYFLTYDPPFHHQKLIMDMCKVRGIKVLCVFFSRIGGKSIVAENGATQDLPQSLEKIELEDIKKNEMNANNESKYSSEAQSYKIDRTATTFDKIRALFDYILLSDTKNTEMNFTYFGRTKRKVILDNFSLILQRKIRGRFMNKNLEKIVDFEKKYVYFPMNIEEELSVLHYSEFFTNQIEVIRNISKSLPINYELYVKEHLFAEFRGWHTIDEYKEILEIPNVTLIHPSFSSEKLIKNSKLVVTTRGTASFDAARHNIPSVVFGDVPFEILPSVYKVNNLNDLPKLIKSALKTKVDPEYLRKYIKLVDSRSVDFSMMEFEVKRNNQFYSGNTLSDVDFYEKDVKKFLENNRNYFKTLVDSHLSKID
jgi:hypothetical protein